MNIYEQHVDWGNNINFIFISHQNSPPPMNIYEQHVGWGNNINFIFISTWMKSGAAQRQGCSEHV